MRQSLTVSTINACSCLQYLAKLAFCIIGFNAIKTLYPAHTSSNFKKFIPDIGSPLRQPEIQSISIVILMLGLYHLGLSVGGQCGRKEQTGGKKRNKKFSCEPHPIRTDNLVIWSHTRYRCARGPTVDCFQYFYKL